MEVRSATFEDSSRRRRNSEKDEDDEGGAGVEWVKYSNRSDATLRMSNLHRSEEEDQEDEKKAEEKKGKDETRLTSDRQALSLNGEAEHGTSVYLYRNNCTVTGGIDTSLSPNPFSSQNNTRLPTAATIQSTILSSTTSTTTPTSTTTTSILNCHEKTGVGVVSSSSSSNHKQNKKDKTTTTTTREDNNDDDSSRINGDTSRLENPFHSGRISDSVTGETIVPETDTTGYPSSNVITTEPTLFPRTSSRDNTAWVESQTTNSPLSDNQAHIINDLDQQTHPNTRIEKRSHTTNGSSTAAYSTTTVATVSQNSNCDPTQTDNYTSRVKDTIHPTAAPTLSNNNNAPNQPSNSSNNNNIKHPSSKATLETIQTSVSTSSGVGAVSSEYASRFHSAAGTLSSYTMGYTAETDYSSSTSWGVAAGGISGTGSGGGGVSADSEGMTGSSCGSSEKMELSSNSASEKTLNSNNPYLPRAYEEHLYEQQQQQEQPYLDLSHEQDVPSHQTHERKDREDDDTTIQSFDSATVTSPAMASLVSTLHVQTLPSQQATFRHHPQAVETPSTVSTAPSSIDDNSFEGFHFSDRDRDLIPGHHHTSSRNHHRLPSWEVSPRQSHRLFTNESEYAFPQQELPPPHPSSHLQHPNPNFNAWNNPPNNNLPPPTNTSHQQNPHRMTTFRDQPPQDSEDPRFGYPPMSPADARWQQHQHHQQQQLQQQHHQRCAPQLPFLPQGRSTTGVDSRTHRQAPNSPFNPHQQLQQRRSPAFPSPHIVPPPPIGSQPGAAAASGNTTPATTPTRNPRAQRLPPSSQSPHRQTPPSFGNHTPSSQSPATNSRSSSEILKTLLRKKACLYEPDTSRAVALVTWLVGRELALEHGYFSRQQLQAGVHACVADKIDSGAITRTKVNRCMQIILNSCFHYIIPRPDGTEENADPFKKAFALEVEDESYLLRSLPEPWNDIVVNREEILQASAAELAEAVSTPVKPTAPVSSMSTPAKKSASSSTGSVSTPQSSPRLSSVSPDKSPTREADSIDDDGDQKRAVLLCFNENVRRAENVFRCHNEFIRDTAHASHLQLSSQEWHLFFGSEAAGTPYLWGNIGIPVPFSEVHGSSRVDALGMMTTDEAAKFRTSWCTKRYDHDHELCGFAHAQINGGWLRRDPLLHHYRDEMCPAVTTVGAGGAAGSNNNLFVLNACPMGENCEYAHSVEEIIYHPRRYKMNTCSATGRQSGCHLGDVCPNFHPVDSYRFPKKSEGRSSRHSRHANHPSGGGGGGGAKGTPNPPSASPILYASPAPISSFEKQMSMPGLQYLFRRQCSVLRAHMIQRRGAGVCSCHYSYFGDDTGILVSSSSQQDNNNNNKNAAATANIQTRRMKQTRGLPNPVVQP